MNTKGLNDISMYSAIIAAWQGKALDSDGRAIGPKPTAENFAVAHVFAKPGKQAFHIACCLREGGQSVAGFQAAWAQGGQGYVTGPANNKRGDVTDDGYFTQSIVTPRPYTFKLDLTEKGKLAVKAAGLTLGNVKAARQPKPKASQAPAVVNPTDEGEHIIDQREPANDEAKPVVAFIEHGINDDGTGYSYAVDADGKRLTD